MILVDTSIWVRHFRTGDSALVTLLERGLVLGHPSVTGELALGNLSGREEILRLLAGLPGADVASPPEVLDFIEARSLYGLGIGYVDAQLLAAIMLTPDTRLWTADKRLAEAAHRLNVLAQMAS